MALRLADALGGSAESWLHMQATFPMAGTAKAAHTDRTVTGSWMIYPMPTMRETVTKLARVGICNPDLNVKYRPQPSHSIKRSVRDYKSRPAEARTETCSCNERWRLRQD